MEKQRQYVEAIWIQQRLIRLLFILIFIQLACQSPAVNNQDHNSIKLINESSDYRILFTQDTSFEYSFNGRPYSFYYRKPENPINRLLVLLPGWNYSVLDWENKTKVVDTALSMGFDVFLCDMGKSVYMDSIYPETRSDYRFYPTRTWLWDSVLNKQFDRPIFDEKRLYLMGLSTGARGSVLLGMEHQNEVGGVIALSGDYLPSLDTNDALMINTMGRYYQFQKRWEEGMNSTYNLDGMPDFLYIGHGLQDEVVSPIQSESLYEHTRVLTTTEKLHYKMQDGEHNYEFWNNSGIEGLMLLMREIPIP